MKNNEHLALFVLGIGTLAVTFLLLFAMNNRDMVGSSIDRQVSGSVAQADVGPQPQIPAPAQANMDVLDHQITETFSKTAAYLGRGTYDEEEHIALLERLEFYGGMSSIKPEYKERAQGFIEDMNRLLTLKESVARRVQLAGQINAVETDVQIHLAKGVKNEAAAKKLLDRIETLYAIHGLSDSQNRQLSTSLAALKNAYKEPVATAKSSPVKATAPKPREQPAPAPVVQARVEPKPAPKPQAAPAPEPAAAAAPAPAPKAPATATASRKADDPKAQAVKEKYYKVMTLVSSYFVDRKYKHDYHAKLTADLVEVSKGKSVLSPDQQDRLSKTISKMKHIEDRYGPQASAR